MKIIVITALLFVIPALTHASSVPKYDVDKFCETVAGGKASIHNACIDMEQKAYDKLKTRWDNIPQTTKDFCGALAKGAGSYQTFIECEKQENDAAKNKKTFKH